MNSAPPFSQPETPTPHDRVLAHEALLVLTRLMSEAPDAQLSIDDATGRGPVVLPHLAVQLLRDILHELSAGRLVAVRSMERELTTQQAADFLAVSRPYLVSLLEMGAIPFRKVGSRRRVQFHHLVIYKRIEDTKRAEALNALTQQSQELDLGYSRPSAALSDSSGAATPIERHSLVT